MKQEIIQDTKDKEFADMKSLWEERTLMFCDLIYQIYKGVDTADLITDLKDNSEDIAKATCSVFKSDSEKREDHEDYYYKLLEKNHPTKGVKLTPEEDVWLKNYMSVSMLTRILKDNVRMVHDYLNYIKENDIQGQKIADEVLQSNIISITGFFKSLSSTWDIELLNSKIIVYYRNLKKQADVLAGAPNPELLESELKVGGEIAKIIYDGMVKWKTKQ